MLGLDCDLHIVADDARAATAGCHRAAVGIGQGYLLVGRRVKLAQIASDALLQLSAASLHLRPREVLVPVVHGFELAAIDGGARGREKAYLTTEFDEACTY